MAVVKADGLRARRRCPPPARRCAAVPTQLGVATPRRRSTLRAAGIDAPLLAWLWVPGEDVAPAVAAGVDLGVSSLAHLDAVLGVVSRAPAAGST